VKTTELFVEQTLTGFMILTAAAVPFLDWETLEELPEVDLSSAAGAIGIAYLLGVIFDRFADTLLERFNRWKRILFAIELKEENKALSPEDPFPEDQLEIEVIYQGDEAWEWMDYIRSRIRVARAMAAFVPILTVSMELTVGLRDRPDMIGAVLAIVVVAYLAAFLAGLILERSSWRLPKTYDLHTAEDCRGARDRMRVAREPAFWLAVFLFALGLGLIPLGNGPARFAMAAVFAAGAVLTAISAWAWGRTTETFLEFLRDFRKWAPKKEKDAGAREEKEEKEEKKDK
jgi:hypothetical protein